MSVSVPVRVGVPGSMSVLVMAVTGMMFVMGMVMHMIVVVMFFRFHRVQIPSMLKCPHAPQGGEQNARP